MISSTRVQLISAEELARALGVSGKTLRAWLRQEARGQNSLVMSHLHSGRWLFTSETAQALAEQFRSRRSATSRGRAGPPGHSSIAKDGPRTSIDWDPRRSNAFRANGFAGFIPLGPLVGSLELPHPDEHLERSGVYAIFAPTGWKPQWRTKGLMNVINPWPVERLRDRWVPDVELVYIGCAGRTVASRTLRKRLEDLLKHGRGSITTSGPHKGGERIWQCTRWKDFTLAWRQTGPYPEPHDLEVAIGQRFVELTSRLPFANERL